MSEWLTGPDGDASLRSLERELDASYQKLRLGSANRSVALGTLLQEFDCLVAMNDMAKLTHGESPLRGPSLSSNTLVLAASRAVSWLSEKGTALSIVPCDRRYYSDPALEFLDHAFKYEFISQFHVELSSGLSSARVNPLNRVVEFSKTYSPGDRLDYGMIFELGLFNSGERPEPTNFDDNDPLRWRRSAKLKYDGRRLILVDVETIRSRPVFQLGESRDIPQQIEHLAVPGYDISVGELIAVFRGLKGWSDAAQMYSLGFASTAEKYRSAIPTQFIDEKEFLRVMCELCGLEEPTVQGAVRCLSYDSRIGAPALYEQPLCRVGKTIAWSAATVVQMSLGDIRRLLARDATTRSVADNMSAAFEGVCIRDVEQVLIASGFQCRRQIRIRGGGEEAEIDVLAVHPAHPSKVLIVEVKAFVAPRTQRQVLSIHEKTVAACDQQRRLLKIWAAVDKVALGRRLGLDPVYSLVDASACVYVGQGNAVSRYIPSAVAVVPPNVFSKAIADSGGDSNRAVDVMKTRDWLRELRPSGVGKVSVPIGRITYRLPVVQSVQQSSLLQIDPTWHETFSLARLVSIMNPRAWQLQRDIEDPRIIIPRSKNKPA